MFQLSHVQKILTIFMIFLVVSTVFYSCVSKANVEATVFVMFTFDTEDFLTPETNPVLGELVGILNKHGVKGEFYIVAEKARVLAERFPEVIEVLAKHTIGYHQNGHSVHPTIAEYSDRKSWREAVEAAFKYETKRIDIYTGKLYMNETGGIKFVEKIFGKKPFTFRPPGYVWSAPTLYALRELGVRSSSISSSFSEVTGYPLNWYLDVLQIPTADLYLESYFVRGALNDLKNQFRGIVEEKSKTGGLIVLGIHPCRLVTRAFWDSNYFNGQNPGNKSNVQLPPLYEEETVRQALGAFDEFLEYVKSYVNVKIVTSESFLEKASKFRLPDAFSSKELSLIAKHLLENWAGRPPSYVELSDGNFISLSEAFIILALTLDQYFNSGISPETIDTSGPWISRVIGPTEISHHSSEISVDIFTLRSVIEGVLKQIKMDLEIPSKIEIENSTVGPADLLYTIAQMVRDIIEDKDVSHDWTIRDFDEMPALSENIRISYGWPCLPKGLDTSAQMKIARLQAWTLKPIPLIPPSPSKPKGPDVRLIIEIAIISLFASLLSVSIVAIIKRLKRRR